MPNGERFMLNAPLVDTSLRSGTDVNTEGQFKGSGHDGKDLTEIGMGTGGGMLVGGLIGGGKGIADRRHYRRYGNRNSLAGKTSLSDFAVRNRTDTGTQPSDGV